MEELSALPFAKLKLLNGQMFAAGQGKISVVPILPDVIAFTVKVNNPSKRDLTLTSLKSKH